MEEFDRDRLDDNRVTLVRDLDPSHVFDHLIEKRVVNEDESDEIKSKETRAEKARELISMLKRKGPDAFKVFTDALLDKYPHLNQLLLRGGASVDCLPGNLIDQHSRGSIQKLNIP
eukprot:GHVO01044960.1.p1 GENE.GHVO01044960.1~~GHVO01044960.1.p1  ORF type:complete len:116 (+),score=8.92 GHVO01044960.1:399-746(+)